MAEVDTVHPLQVPVAQVTRKVTNLGHPSLYYSSLPSVSATSNDGVLALGESLTITNTTWFLSSVPGGEIELSSPDVVISPVTSLGLVNAATYGARMDGISDDTAAMTLLHGAVNNGTVRGYYLTGPVKLTAALPTLTTAVDIKFFNGAYLDFSSIQSTATFTGIKLEGGIGGNKLLTEDAAYGAFVLACAEHFFEGQLLKILDPTTVWDAAGQKSHPGEIVEVGNPDGGMAGFNGKNNEVNGCPKGTIVTDIYAGNLNPISNGASLIPANGQIKISNQVFTYESFSVASNVAHFVLTAPTEIEVGLNQGTRVQVLPPEGKVFLRTPITHEYGYKVSNGAEVKLITPVGRSTIENPWIKGPGPAAQFIGIHAELAIHLEVRRPTIEDCWVAGVRFFDVLYSHVDDPFISNARQIVFGSAGLQGYGINFSFCTQDCSVRGGRSVRTRHSYTQGSGGEGLPRRNVVMDHTSQSAFADAFDSHGGAEDATWIRCTAIMPNGVGFNINCPKATLTACRAVKPNSGGVLCGNQGIGVTEYDIDCRVDNAQTGSGISVNAQSSTSGLNPKSIKIRGQINGCPQYGVTVVGSGEGGSINWRHENVDIDVQVNECAQGAPYAAVLVASADNVRVKLQATKLAKARVGVLLRDVRYFTVENGPIGWLEENAGNLATSVTVGAAGGASGSTHGVIREGPLFNRGTGGSTTLDANTTKVWVYPGPDEKVTLGAGEGNQKCTVP